MKIKDNLIIYMKGFLMGICDIIPGISGGTIAFITGIYYRLINAVKHLSSQLALDFFRFLFFMDKKHYSILRENVRNCEFPFLIFLGGGILTAIFIGSWIISWLLKIYFTYTISFFIGLILASSTVIYKKIESHNIKNVVFGVIGLALGLSLTFAIPVSIEITLPYVVFGGFIAISAMFLPGISGAFILLILGLYEHMINALHSIRSNYLTILSFALGASFGVVVVSRVISYLFRKDRCKTLYVLLGLVIGCLGIPIRKVIQSDMLWGINVYFLIGLFLIFGVGFGYSISKLDRENQQ